MTSGRRCVKIFSAIVGRAEAAAKCNEEGGSLAIITSMSDNERVQ